LHDRWQGRNYEDSDRRIKFTVPESLYIGNSYEVQQVEEQASELNFSRNYSVQDDHGPPQISELASFLVFTKTGSYVFLAHETDYGGHDVEKDKKYSESLFKKKCKELKLKITSTEDKRMTIANLEFVGYSVKFTIKNNNYEKNVLFCLANSEFQCISYLLVNDSNQDLLDFIQSWTS